MAKKPDVLDLTGIFDHPDPDEAQKLFDKLPQAHHAKLRAAVQGHVQIQPTGSVQGSPIQMTDQDAENERQTFQAQNISAISEGAKPPVPATGSTTIPKRAPEMGAVIS